jgi:ribosomal protein L24
MSTFEKGDRVVVTQGDFAGRRATVTDTDVVGDGIDVRLDDGRVIDTEEAHVAPCADR